MSASSGPSGVDCLLLAVVWCFVVLGPYTKVEESFGIQAVHDLLHHRTELSQYDHNEFPGVVPRTFVGPGVVAAAAAPLQFLASKLWPEIPGIYTLMLVRGVLGTLVWLCFTSFRSAVSKRFGADVGTALVLVCCTQFHLPFYMSRTLPNTFALALTMLAFAQLLRRELAGDRCAVNLLVFCTVLFRCDMIVLLGCIALFLLLEGRATVYLGFIWGVQSGVAALLLSVAVDSLMWQRWLWPEGEVLWFNTVLNKSSEWGVMPFGWYFTSALPRVLTAGAPLLVAGLMRSPCPPPMPRPLTCSSALGWLRLWLGQWDGSALLQLAPVLLFIALYSFLPHKELRFILPAVPMLNLGVALGIAKFYRAARRVEDKDQRGNKPASALAQPLLMAAGAALCLAACATAVAAAASFGNYPGGVALAELHEWHDASSDQVQQQQQQQQQQHVVHVHIDAAAAMTGISRFCERKTVMSGGSANLTGPRWVYSKEENLGTPAQYARFDYLVTADPGADARAGFEVAKVVPGFERMELTAIELGVKLPWVRLVSKPMLWIMKRKNDF